MGGKSARKKQPRPLSLNFQNIMTSQTIQTTEHCSNKTSEHSFSPHQLDHAHPSPVGLSIESPSADSTNMIFGAQSSLNIPQQDQHSFKPLSPRPKPMLSSTFGYSSNSRPSNINTDSSANSNLSSIFLSLSPTSIVDTSLTLSPPLQLPAFPVNHHDYKRSATAELSRTQSGYFAKIRHGSAKDINILELITKQEFNGIASSVPATPNSITSGVPSGQSSASHLGSFASSTWTAANSSKKHCNECVSMNHTSIVTSSPLKRVTIPEQMNSSYASPDPMESSFAFSDQAGSHALTSSSSFASTLSPASTPDHHVKFKSDDLLASWPIPPSFNSSITDGLRKAATYYPLRSILSKSTSPYPMNLMGTQSGSTLAYLDLSSATRPHPSFLDEGHQSGSFRETNCNQITSNASSALKLDRSLDKLESTAMSRRRSSDVSVRSDTTEGTFYEDAREKAEWMEIDSGDAYDDLEKTAASARRISQSLTMMNGFGAINHACKAQIRHPTRSPILHSPASMAAAVPTARSNYSLPTSRQFSSSAQRSDRWSDEPQLSSRSPHASDHHDDDYNFSRSRNQFEQLFSSVPLFTRMSLSLARDDKEEDKFSVKSSRKDQLFRGDEDDLRPIQEAPDLENADTVNHGRPSPPSSGNPRRRLKPLILRPVTPTVIPTRKRASTQSYKLLSKESSIDSTSITGYSSPPNPNSRSDLSRVSNESVPTFTSGEVPSFRRYHKLNSDKLISTDAEILRSEAPATHSRQGLLSSPMDSSINFSANRRESNSECSVANPSHNNNDLNFPNLTELSEEADKISKHDSSTLIDTVSPSPHTASDCMSLAEKASIDSIINGSSLISLEGKNLTAVEDTVTFLKGHQVECSQAATATDSNLEMPKASGLTKHESISFLNLPTLSAGSSRVCAHSETINPRMRPTPRKRNISNIFATRQTLLNVKKELPTTDSSLFTKGSPDSPWPNEVHSSPQRTSIPQKGENYVKGTLPNGSKIKNRLMGNNRLILSLTRMEAQEAKLLDLTSVNKQNAFHECSPMKEKDAKKLVKGKFKRISQPILLSGEEERHALWGMISSGKASDNHLR